MSAIGPGDWVECVDGRASGPVTRASRYLCGGEPLVGAIYRVRQIFRGRYQDDTVGEGLRLCGIVAVNASGIEGGWPVEYFRPIYRPKADLIESLKTPAKREGVPA